MIRWSICAMLILPCFGFIPSTTAQDTKTDSIDSLHVHYLEILTDTSHSYPFGYWCSNFGIPPAGRMAVNYLAERRDSTTLRQVLMADHPIGRIYAMETLLRWSQKNQLQLTEEDTARMRQIVQQTKKVETCYGCLWDYERIPQFLPPELLKTLRETTP